MATDVTSLEVFICCNDWDKSYLFLYLLYVQSNLLLWVNYECLMKITESRYDRLHCASQYPYIGSQSYQFAQQKTQIS